MKHQYNYTHSTEGTGFLLPHPSPLPHAAQGGEGILRCFKKPVPSNEMSIELNHRTLRFC